jgi:hypothetical protein
MSCVYYGIYLVHTIIYRNNTGANERMSMEPFLDFIVVMIYLLILYILAILPITSIQFRCLNHLRRYTITTEKNEIDYFN